MQGSTLNFVCLLQHQGVIADNPVQSASEATRRTEHVVYENMHVLPMKPERSKLQQSSFLSPLAALHVQQCILYKLGACDHEQGLPDAQKYSRKQALEEACGTLHRHHQDTMRHPLRLD